MFAFSVTGVLGLSCGENPVILGSTVSIRYQHWTDGQTDFHTYYVLLLTATDDTRKK